MPTGPRPALVVSAPRGGSAAAGGSPEPGGGAGADGRTGSLRCEATDRSMRHLPPGARLVGAAGPTIERMAAARESNPGAPGHAGVGRETAGVTIIGVAAAGNVRDVPQPGRGFLRETDRVRP